MGRMQPVDCKVRSGVSAKADREQRAPACSAGGVGSVSQSSVGASGTVRGQWTSTGSVFGSAVSPGCARTEAGRPACCGEVRQRQERTGYTDVGGHLPADRKMPSPVLAEDDDGPGLPVLYYPTYMGTSQGRSAKDEAARGELPPRDRAKRLRPAASSTRRGCGPGRAGRRLGLAASFGRPDGRPPTRTRGCRLP